MRTVACSLPRVANSGQYSATGASTSSRPRDASTCAHSAVAPLVQEWTTEIVSRPNVPPHTSTTASPPTVMHSDAPVSPRSAKLASNASTTGWNRSSQVPSAKTLSQESDHRVPRALVGRPVVLQTRDADLADVGVGEAVADTPVHLDLPVGDACLLHVVFEGKPVG